MLKKQIVFVLTLAASNLAFADSRYQALSQKLYPKSQTDQAFVAKFFEIVELHKKNDPLLEGRGPSIREYSLDKIKFAFMINETKDTVDLAFFNWTLPTFTGLTLEPALTQLYGANVYVLRGVSKNAIASQGYNNDQLMNFSYIHGARYRETQIKLGNPDYQAPEQFLNWKPHPGYMDRSHPLRQTLDTKVLVLLSPDKELFMQQAGATAQSRPHIEAMFNQKGGYYNMIMGMMVHETFHVKEDEDHVNRLADKRGIPVDRKALVEQLKSDAYLKSLFATYAKIVFSLGDSLKRPTVTTVEREQLSDLKVIISEIKTKYPNAWAFIWDCEYTEGFAEYVSAYSMIQANVTSFARQINLQKTDEENNFAYRTGTIGGLYLAHRIKQMPFNNNEDHSTSVWELVLGRTNATTTAKTATELVGKYQNYPFQTEDEINNCIEYLVSSVMEN